MGNFKVAENIANIRLTAGVMLKEVAVVVEDSTELSKASLCSRQFIRRIHFSHPYVSRKQ